MGKSLYMETTRISAQQSAEQVSRLLGGAGARQILFEYDEGREITALYFQLRVQERDVAFTLPVRVEPIFRILNGRRRRARADRTGVDKAQARRVAWRQILRWLQAQCALLETEMVQAAEVFLPYMQVQPDRTLYEHLAERGLALKAPAKGDGGGRGTG